MWAEIPMFLIFPRSSTSGVLVEAFRLKDVLRQGRKGVVEKEGTREEEERRMEEIRVSAGPPTILFLQQSQGPGLKQPQAGLDGTIVLLNTIITTFSNSR